MLRDPGTMSGAADGGPLAVALYSPGWPPDAFPNGVVTSVATVAEALRARGHRAHVLAGVLAAGTEAAGDVHDLGAWRRPPTAAGRAVERVAFRLRPEAARAAGAARAIRRAVGALAAGPGLDLLEMEESFGWCGAVAGRVPVPVVARLHGPWFLNGPNDGADPGSAAFRRRVRAEGEALRRVGAITAPSRDVLERTRAHYGLALEGAEVIPNATPEVPPGRRWRPEESDPVRILFIGRFDLHKGGDTIIDAFALLWRDRPSARLTFVGPDPGLVRDGRRWDLRSYVEHRLPGALGDGRVEWLGRRPHAELDALRRRAAVTVAPSRDENFPMAIIEALAVGCPLVAARAGGAAEAFEHGIHGLYCPPGDPAGLAEALAAMLADPARAAAMGRAAAEHCRRRYAPEAVAERTARFYRRVLSGAAATGAAREARP